MNSINSPYQSNAGAYKTYYPLAANQTSETAPSRLSRAYNPSPVSNSFPASELKQISKITPSLNQAYIVSITGSNTAAYGNSVSGDNGTSGNSAIYGNNSASGSNQYSPFHGGIKSPINYPFSIKGTVSNQASYVNQGHYISDNGAESTGQNRSSIDTSSSYGENAAESSSSVEKSDNTPTALTDQELKLLEELKNADTEVRAHEMAHIAAGGQYVTSGAKLEYRKGPDGNNYAVAGEVSIDSSPIPGDPKATAEKMRQIQQAALAPASPSSQDRKVASRASALAAKALSELMIQQVKERTSGNEQQAFGSIKQASDSYSRTDNIPMEEQTRKNINIAA
ncbi:conserved hypothetical protein [Desulfamplus magnetovallimortis]|uniref:SprA-related family n=1 Tax=Desulfamplus magnetovallimortis TaxID=1246637 RepID=A0A1W1HE15_9BACT|nr:putative metalloprotease CJM1_0395 family protein [Desulfamplus magnetovallimortis]SLM30741.1 conserved hypothetical protein [Desulfamplus magnetovallimortis]